jgi:hypothetical protein
MTAGQYLSYQGDDSHRPIIAMYSAMNSHPTLDNPAVPYLRAVPDPTGLGEERWGHGFGLSQWGAARRARAGQSYRQILGYYFTDVNLQNALDPSQPIAGLLGPTQNGYLPLGGLRWRTLAPFTGLPSSLVVSSSTGLTRTFSVTATQTISYTDVITHSDGLTETVILTGTTTVTETTYQTEPVTLPGSGVWQQPLEIADDGAVMATLYLNETMQESITLWVDRTAPLPPELTLPATTDIPTVTLAAAAPAGSVLGLSNGWVWEGEALLREIDSGRVVSDTDASAGAALEARPGVDRPSHWYGPYTTALPPAATYRALFRLRVGDHPARSADGVLPDRPLARLDVADQMGTVRLGLRDIWASDFAGPDRYAEIPVDFHIFEASQGIEFRVEWYGDVALALDRVWVWQLQNGQSAVERPWRLGLGGSPTVYAMSFDAAANASEAVSATVQMVDDGPPVFGTVSGPVGWQTALPITLTTTVYDRVSGLDGASGESRQSLGRAALDGSVGRCRRSRGRRRISSPLSHCRPGRDAPNQPGVYPEAGPHPAGDACQRHPDQRRADFVPHWLVRRTVAGTDRRVGRGQRTLWRGLCAGQSPLSLLHRAVSPHSGGLACGALLGAGYGGELSLQRVFRSGDRHQSTDGLGAAEPGRSGRGCASNLGRQRSALRAGGLSGGDSAGRR